MNFFGSRISKNLAYTPEGFLICKNVKIGRSGALQYLGEEVGINGDNSIITVYRTTKENSAPETLASFEGKPITDNHPDEDVTPDNYHYYQRGHIQNVRAADNYIIADLFVTDRKLIEDITSGVKREVSCGYDTTYVEDEQGNLFQTNIRGNHLAIVENGRAGGTVKIQDSKSEVLKMAKRNSEKILKDFVKKVRDAQTSEEVEELIEDAAEDLVNSAQNTELPTNPNAEVKSDPNTQPVTMENVMQAVKALEAKVNQIITGKPTSDGTPEGDLDKAVSELEGGIQSQVPNKDPAQVLQQDEEPKDLEGGEDIDKPTDNTNQSAADEEAVGEDNSGMDVDEQSVIMNDTAAKILKSTREAIANISNPAEKRKVADAALKAVKDLIKSKSNSSIKRVMKPVKSADSANTDGIAQNYYDKLNPAMRRKYNIK